jgi:tetratricopeptide (TPR) repeat protein
MTRRVGWYEVACCLLLFFAGGPAWLGGQPFDLILPDDQVQESLATELRRLHEIERDMALERLTREPTQVEGMIELGELRLRQGKLEEAQRFFEMALERRPKNFRANEGLAMTKYHQGDFRSTKEIFDRLMQMYPLSDRLQQNLEKVRSRLLSTGQLGLEIREDNRGVLDITTHLEASFPSFTYRKLAARYRVSTWHLEERGQEIDSTTLAGSFDYILNHRSKVSATFAPETFSNKESITGYTFSGVTGAAPFQLSLAAGRAVFRENYATAKLGLFEDFGTLTLAGELNERVRIIQTYTATDLSDGNGRRQFGSEVLYFMHRRGIPLLSLTGRISATSYERQTTTDGGGYTYWCPSDFRSASLNVGWERAVGSRWWWGFDAGFIQNSYRDVSPETLWEKGFGLSVHASYRYPTGRLHAEFGDAIRQYYRERRLSIYGSHEF